MFTIGAICIIISCLGFLGGVNSFSIVFLFVGIFCIIMEVEKQDTVQNNTQVVKVRLTVEQAYDRLLAMSNKKCDLIKMGNTIILRKYYSDKDREKYNKIKNYLATDSTLEEQYRTDINIYNNVKAYMDKDNNQIINYLNNWNCYCSFVQEIYFGSQLQLKTINGKLMIDDFNGIYKY